MSILYVIAKYITFPGAFLRCFWEQFMCKVQKVPIENNKCLQTNEMCGHIEHEMINGKVKSFFNAFIPGLIVFIFGLACFIPAFINLYMLDVAGTFNKIVMFVLLYLAMSMLTNIFPNVEDAMIMWENYKQLGIILKIVFFLGASIMYLGSYIEKYSISFFTNAIIAALIIIL